MREPTEAEFLKDVATHQMTILREDGVHRHIRFARPGTGCMYFDLITWPGSLCYTGDMGTYVFSRLTDMFEFFRTDRRGEDGLYINLGYWAEKLQAVDKHSPPMEFSLEKFRDVVRGYIEDEDTPEDFKAAVTEELLDEDFEHEHAAYQAAYDFRHGNRGLDDFFEHSMKEYTQRFIWCCYALAWGIKLYDARQPQPGAAE